MKSRFKPTLILIAIATLSGNSVLAADSTAEKLKALQDEKALLDAQLARDVSEAASIKGAADLAKAKAAAVDADRLSWEAKTARDNAEAAAVAAASALSKVRSSASTQDASNATAKLTADAALATAKVGADSAEVTALIAAFGKPANLGSDGTVTISDSTSGMLLETRSGSLAITAVLAQNLCGVLASKGIKDAFVAPPDLDKKVLASSLFLNEFNALQRVLGDPSIKPYAQAVTKSQISAAAVMSAVTMLQLGATSLQSVAKLFRSDYAVALADGGRGAWLESFLAAKCPEQLPYANVEGVIRANGFAAQFATLQSLANVPDSLANAKAAAKRRLDSATDAIAKKVAKKEEPSSTESQEKVDAQAAFNQIADLEPLSTRIKALIDSVTSKPDSFIDALVWQAFSNFADKPRLTVSLSTQDGQVTKTNWLFGKSVYGRSAGELIYRISTADGKVPLAGYVTATNSDGKYDFGTNVAPKALGVSFP